MEGSLTGSLYLTVKGARRMRIVPFLGDSSTPFWTMLMLPHGDVAQAGSAVMANMINKNKGNRQKVLLQNMFKCLIIGI